MSTNVLLARLLTVQSDPRFAEMRRLRALMVSLQSPPSAPYASGLVADIDHLICGTASAWLAAHKAWEATLPTAEVWAAAPKLVDPEPGDTALWFCQHTWVIPVMLYRRQGMNRDGRDWYVARLDDPPLPPTYTKPALQRANPDVLRQLGLPD